MSVWFQSSCSFYYSEALGGVASTLWTSGESFSQPLLRLTAYMRFLDTGVPSRLWRQDFSLPAHLCLITVSQTHQCPIHSTTGLTVTSILEKAPVSRNAVLTYSVVTCSIPPTFSHADTVLTKSLISSCTWQLFLLAVWSLSFPFPSHTPHWFQRCGSKIEI